MYIIIVLQEDITNFRPKLAAILWDSRFNTRKGFEDSEETEEAMGTPSDVEVIDPSDVELIQSLSGVTKDIHTDAYLCTGICISVYWNIICEQTRIIACSFNVHQVGRRCGIFAVSSFPYNTI